VVVLSRDAARAERQLNALCEELRVGAEHLRAAAWDPRRDGAWCEELAAADAVVHLAGTPVAGRWNEQRKRAIETSRVESTERIVAAMARAESKPRCFVCASATGYYGSDRPNQVSEESSPGSDFLADVVLKWEAAAQRAEQHEIRAVQLRLGVVLGAGGGALAKMVGPLRMCVAGPVGKGDNDVSWVHIDDVVNMALWAVDDASLHGAINVTAPNPVTLRELSRKMAKVLGRPRFGAPVFVARMMLGEAVTVVVGNQNVCPKRALELGYEFRYPDIVPALEASLVRR